MKLKTIKYPNRSQWASLSERPGLIRDKLEETVKNIIQNVQENGDEAIIQYNHQFDGTKTSDLQSSLAGKAFNVDPALANAIRMAKGNIEAFHLLQKEPLQVVETVPGVRCWRKSVAISNVGLYIPGGSAPLFSTLLMLAIPAKIAGCENIIVCTPPQKDGTLPDVIGWTAQLLGLETIYLTGGAQAIAAMAIGTESIPKVDKIFGPGNQYVTKAKQEIQKSGVAIDMPAGPSEVLVIADNRANPSFVAADLLSQAEHGPDSQVILVSNSEPFIEAVDEAIEMQLPELPRKEIAERALNNSKSIVFADLNQAIDFSNEYAPEHLIISTTNNKQLADKVINAGSVFLGTWSCESAGDYASGTNHTLPTAGFAKSYSGVSVDSFVKKITYQEINEEGIKALGPEIEQMAEAEQLYAHKNAVTLRLNQLKDV